MCYKINYLLSWHDFPMMDQWKINSCIDLYTFCMTAREQTHFEIRIDMEFENMQQLDDAMKITINDKDVDKVHVGFNQYVNVDTIQHFLYRDYPDNQ